MEGIYLRGWSERDHLAEEAMKLIIKNVIKTNPQAIAQYAYDIADAMVEERIKRTEKEK